MTVNGYNLIILLGAIHGLVLSLLLVFSRRNSRLGNAPARFGACFSTRYPS